MANLIYVSWSCFSGDGGGFYAILSGLLTHTHTYKNIVRDKEFCVNFISSKYYDNAIETIKENNIETDEIAAGGFTAESSKLIRAPRIKEAFISYECKLESISDLSGKGRSSLIIGEVINAAVRKVIMTLQKDVAMTALCIIFILQKIQYRGWVKKALLQSLNQ